MIVPTSPTTNKISRRYIAFSPDESPSMHKGGQLIIRPLFVYTPKLSTTDKKRMEVAQFRKNRFDFLITGEFQQLSYIPTPKVK